MDHIMSQDSIYIHKKVCLCTLDFCVPRRWPCTVHLRLTRTGEYIYVCQNANQRSLQNY